VPTILLHGAPTMTHKARNTARCAPTACCHACAEATECCTSTQQSRQAHWFHPLSFQRIQALLTLFPKSFSPFPHGTCLLSASDRYLALDEIYHPLCAPIPRNVTLGRQTVHEGLQIIHRTVTFTGALFLEASTCAFVGCTSRGYNSRP
jgi:hypothetical protein